MQTTDPTPPNSSRIEDEIREILERADRPPTVIDQVRSRSSAGQDTLRNALQLRPTGNPSPRISLAVSFGAAVAAALLSGPVPWLAVVLAFLSFAALASLWFNRSEPVVGRTKWRGQELGSGGSTALDEWRARRDRPRE
jgi:hypothetical protein